VLVRLLPEAHRFQRWFTALLARRRQVTLGVCRSLCVHLLARSLLLQQLTARLAFLYLLGRWRRQCLLEVRIVRWQHLHSLHRSEFLAWRTRRLPLGLSSWFLWCLWLTTHLAEILEDWWAQCLSPAVILLLLPPWFGEYVLRLLEVHWVAVGFVAGIGTWTTIYFAGAKRLEMLNLPAFVVESNSGTLRFHVDTWRSNYKPLHRWVKLFG